MLVPRLPIVALIPRRIYSASQKKFCLRAAEYGRPLRAANRRLPTPSGNGGERQTPVIFTPRAVLDPMLQTMMDPGTSLPVIPLHKSRRSLPPG